MNVYLLRKGTAPSKVGRGSGGASIMREATEARAL